MLLGIRCGGAGGCLAPGHGDTTGQNTIPCELISLMFVIFVQSPTKIFFEYVLGVWVRVPVMTLVSLSKILYYNYLSSPRGIKG